jgi:hypothetical protein
MAQIMTQSESNPMAECRSRTGQIHAKLVVPTKDNGRPIG